MPVTELKKIDSTLQELIHLFNNSLKSFQKHYFITHHQNKILTSLKNNISSDEAYIVLDFSQNYNAKYHEEIQAVHFGASKKQISLQTGVIYLKDTNISFVSPSDCLRHEAPAVWALLAPVLKHLMQIHPNITCVHFQSDGPTAQYKNKNNFHLFKLYCKEFNLERATWNYTSAGHGKSSADGIGGTVKNMCDNFVACGNNILCANDVRNLIRNKNCQIEAFVVTEEEINAVAAKLDSQIPSVQQTMKIHQVMWSKKNETELFTRYLRGIDCINKDNCTHYGLFDETIKTTNYYQSTNEFKNGDWIVVIYDKWYAGVIEDVKNDFMVTKFLSYTKNEYCFVQPPRPEDT